MSIEDTLYPQLKHKVLEVVQEAKKIMRHSKRDYLTSADVELAMKKLNIPPIFGYSLADPIEYQDGDSHKPVSAFLNPSEGARSNGR